MYVEEKRRRYRREEQEAPKKKRGKRLLVILLVVLVVRLGGGVLVKLCERQEPQTIADECGKVLCLPTIITEQLFIQFALRDASFLVLFHTNRTYHQNELAGGDDEKTAMTTTTTTTQFPSSSSSELPGVVGAGGGSGALVVNRRRQEGNPVLKYVRNVRYEWGDIGPDFECGPTFGVVYLSFKYHKQHPEYVYTRINGKAENRYRNKVLLGYCNMEEPRHVLRELNMICFREAWTLVVVYTVEEAAEYIELFKTTQKKEITIKKKTIDDGGDSSMSDERRRNRETAIGFLTAARSITKTDADRLLYHFGTLQEISTAPETAISACPGVGPIKAKNLHSFLHTIVSANDQ
ncbi:hypothetical protein B9Z55_001392 [Caenorhabditis nigoni]|nr:hypothetical protein B9Z55_001392 [Caenorhabditis nigoni]